ncbi:MAG: MFS transporter [Caldiserica bacterium]|nr:MFS transporter [Caldisericota bacterium]
MKKHLKKAAQFLGLNRSIVGILSMVILVGMGEHMAEQYLPKYLLALGAGFISVGFLSAMDNFLGAIYSYFGGMVAHRYGSKRSLLIFNLITMFGFLLVIAFPNWIVVILAAAMFISWSAISLPATMELVSKVLPKNKRTMGVSIHSLTRRIPMALGPVIGAFFIYYYGDVAGIRIAFVVSACFVTVATILQQVLIVDDRKGIVVTKERQRAKALFSQMSPQLKNLLVSDILIRFCQQIPDAFVVIWALGSGATPGYVNVLQFGALKTIEMVTAMVVYIPVAYFADKLGKKPFVIVTFIFFTLFPLVLIFSKNFTLLVLAFILRGLKEFGEPSRKAMIMDLAPEDKKAAMFGLYYLLRDTIVSVAAFGGGLLWMISPQVNLITAFGIGIIGTIYFIMFGKDVSVPQHVNA